MEINGKKIVYIGIKLDSDAEKMCVETAHEFLPEKNSVGILPGYKIFGDHVTLGFGSNVQDDLVKVIGMSVTLHPHRILVDESGAGIFFKESSLEKRGIPYHNGNSRPHVTLVMWNDVPPAHMGTVCDRNHRVYIADGTRIVSGRIGAYLSDGTWYFG